MDSQSIIGVVALLVALLIALPPACLFLYRKYRCYRVSRDQRQYTAAFSRFVNVFIKSRDTPSDTHARLKHLADQLARSAIIIYEHPHYMTAHRFDQRLTLIRKPSGGCVIVSAHLVADGSRSSMKRLAPQFRRTFFYVDSWSPWGVHLIKQFSLYIYLRVQNIFLYTSVS